MQFLYCGHISHRKHIPLSLSLTHSGLSSSYAQDNHRLKQRASEWVSVCVWVYCLLAGCVLTVQYAWNNNKNDVYNTDTTLHSIWHCTHSGLAWLDWRGIGFTSNQMILFSISYDTPRYHMCMHVTHRTIFNSFGVVCRCFSILF